MAAVISVAPDSDEACDYDRRHLALYAALIDADDADRDWRWAAASILGLDVDANGAEACWRSHLDRARWIIGDGLGAALQAFSARPASID